MVEMMSLLCEGAVKSNDRERRRVHALHKIGPFEAVIHSSAILSSAVDEFSRNE